jgi:hypothetical protein
VARGEVSSNPTLRIEKPAVRSKIKRVASPAEAAQLLDLLDPADRPLWRPPYTLAYGAAN